MPDNFDDDKKINIKQENEIINEDENELLQTSNSPIRVPDVHPELKKPGDIFSQKVSTTGKIITKLNTSEKKNTLVKNNKKDGSEGKSVAYIMEPDEKN